MTATPSKSALGGLCVLLFWLLTGVQNLQAQEHGSWYDSIYGLMKSDLERLVSRQEAYHSTNNEYASALDFLDFRPSESVTLDIIASQSGYSAIATHESLGPYWGCAVFSGDIHLPTYPLTPEVPGEPICTEGGPEAPLPGLPSELLTEPTFTPYTVAPEVLNPEEVGRALERAYPPILRDMGLGGTARIWILLDQEGVIRRCVLSQSSGYREMDNVALRVAATIEFSPALNGDQTVAVWISYPITFAIRR